MTEPKTTYRTFKYYTIFSLEGFSSPFKEIKVADGIVIKKATLKGTGMFFIRAKDFRIREHVDELCKNQFFLHYYCDWTATSQDTFDEPGAKNIERFKKMFRLFQAGSVDIRFYKNHLLNEADGKYNSLGFVMIPSIDKSNYNGFDLNKENKGRFKIFCKNYLAFGFDKSKAIDIAIRRFNYSYQKQEWEDQIIDLMIAFEALFVKGEGEISYRLALRVANFVEGYEKGVIFSFMKQCYNLRSRVVHGDLIKKKEVKIGNDVFGEKEIIVNLRVFLRLVIQKCINRYTVSQMDSLVEKIDDKIIGISDFSQAKNELAD